MTVKRPEISAATLAIIVAVYLLAVANLTFWSKAWKGFEGGIAFFAFGGATLALFIGVLVAVCFKYIAKPIYIFLILSAVPAAYFTDTFGTIINSGMIENAVTTTSAEGGEFITRAFYLHFVLLGVLPSLLILWVRVRYGSFVGRLSTNLALFVIAIAVAAGLIYSQLGRVIVTIRQDHAMLETLNPSGPVSSAIKYALSRFEDRHVVRHKFGVDARRGPWISKETRPVITIVVAGETARAMNFSLNGYARKTNPELEKLDVLNFSNATSCGTDTAESIPCMFSGYRRGEFTKGKAKRRETLMDIVRHAGLAAYWWDNNTGSKGVADLINFSSLTGDHDPAQCANGICRDGIFLKRLDTLIGSTTRDTVIVLHQIGSHGPSYYLRYPEEFRKFTPDCRNDQLTDCPLDQVVNAYDNTILYTDHFLASVIGLLKKHDATASGAMFYVSDHGESLGENGLYLHGAPYAIAPPEQTHVPLIVWFSQGYKALAGLDDACLARLPAGHYSHDNVFHTVLGMMDIETLAYKSELDMFRACRPD